MTTKPPHQPFPPLTISRPELLDQGSDGTFRGLVDDLLAFGSQLQRAREALARSLGVAPPHYNILMAVARAARPGGASVSDIAAALNVSVPFVVTQTGQLVQSGLLHKGVDPSDRRRVNMVLTERSREALDRLAPEQVRINDVLFATLSRQDMDRLRQQIGKLLASASELEL